jgi:hypothetical protein
MKNLAQVALSCGKQSIFTMRGPVAQLDGKMNISAKMLKEAVLNIYRGIKMVELLLEKGGAEASITVEVAIEAAKKYYFEKSETNT